MTKTVLLSAIVVFLAFGGRALFSDAPDVASNRSDGVHPFLTADDNEYIGADRCRTCHRKEATGNQYGVWEESAHAQAWVALGSDEAKAIAADKGIDDPQQADECLKCHVTAFGVDASMLGPKFSAEQGVSCESCHGPGGGYYKKATMEGVRAGEIDAGSVGLILPTEETCVGCHNDESPTFKGFNFDEYKAKIAHPIPEG